MPRERPFNFPLFPKFLLPPVVFRRTSQWSGNVPPDHPPEAPAEGARTSKYLHGHVSYLRCSRCAVDLCLTSQIVSKGFTGRHGRAYLVSPEPLASAVSVNLSSSPTASLPNTVSQKPVPRQLVTGAHTVSDISCAFCGSVLGWKYVAAEEESQRYKVGKCILETKRVTTSSCWESTPSIDYAESLNQVLPEQLELGVFGNEVEFDSQDEDECEDLFAGIWSPSLAACRRSRKFGHRPGMSAID
ncbi:yippee family [Aspergillus sclerotialis]|uniref:Yippee family n=1 Tax=Aspergillus sclerotialis TaxID=2070753 RepID=A0A3A2ZCX2_9EURO|nr:yippee family [Aspergillus sclerotialis]